VISFPLLLTTSGLVWPAVAWPVSYNFCQRERPRKPNCNTWTSLNMSRTEGWLIWGGTWQPSLYELTPQYTDTGEATLQVQFRSKLFPTLPLVPCALLYLSFRSFVAVYSIKPHYIAGAHKSTWHHTSDDKHIWTGCKGSTIDFQISYWAKQRGETEELPSDRTSAPVRRWTLTAGYLLSAFAARCTVICCLASRHLSCSSIYA
jgi:hypothetical protein